MHLVRFAIKSESFQTCNGSNHSFYFCTQITTGIKMKMYNQGFSFITKPLRCSNISESFQDCVGSKPLSYFCTRIKDEQKSKNMVNHELNNLRNFARCWNNLDSNSLKDILSNDVVYYSQWTTSQIVGKDNFLEYLQSKFDAIKVAMQSALITLTAELAIHPGVNNRSCIALKQISADGITLVLILLVTTDNKISRIDSCYLPTANELIMTGECPR